MSPSLDLDKVVASTLGDCFLGAFIMDVCVFFFLFIYLEYFIITIIIFLNPN